MQSVTVAGRSIVYSLTGTGSPAVVLEAGLGDTAATWDAVVEALASQTSVCRYNRAGLAGSEKAPTPRTVADLVSDLHGLLAVLAVGGPFVLVGHSFAAQVVRLYAYYYPLSVGGLVLVDPSHEDKYDRFAAVLSPALLQRQTSFLADPQRNSEHIDLPASQAELHTAKIPLSIPLRVLTREYPVPPSGVWPDEEIERIEMDLQRELLLLSPDSKQTKAVGSGHFIQHDRPDLVIAAVGEVVEQVRMRL